MKKMISLLIVFAMMFSFFSCGDSSKHEGEAKTPSGSRAQKGRTYQDVVSNFKEKGFTNIKTEALEDLVTGWMTKDGEVESVSVDGNEGYSADVWYSNNVDVVITYHTFPKDKTADISKGTGEAQQTVKKDANETKVDDLKTGETKDKNLTVDNCEDLKKILQLKDPADPIIKEFADKYKGKIIEFDGNITFINNHGNYKTRYDIGISQGDYNETQQSGPSFQFSDVGVYDLGIKELYLPDFVKTGSNIHIIAKVEEYNSKSQLFKLNPISIKTI